MAALQRVVNAYTDDVSENNIHRQEILSHELTIGISVFKLGLSVQSNPCIIII